jgi:GAF domain-containing protein
MNNTEPNQTITDVFGHSGAYEMHRPDITSEYKDKWQGILDLAVELFQVPNALISKIEPPDITILLSNNSEKNPYKRGSKRSLGTGLYCETVIESRAPLMVSNALEDENCKDNPNIAHGMVSYLGFPVMWPDGNMFGTISVMDDKDNSYNELYRNVMEHFRDVLCADLQYLTTIADHAEEFNVMNREQLVEIEKQTREMRQRTDELERFNKVMVGREKRMIVLKQQINDLSKDLGRDAPYAQWALEEQDDAGNTGGIFTRD